ncbi:phosphonate C-P lyase system protein PhnH [Thalassobacillus sp. C254]|uniref:phosphonate C-P lyase system protein PhnH n=1 Tax=Thalassobacillus sp. C254 TaxID=1225341 RepID=UPI0006CFEFA6|nr:phosphonate C-P lyase system protein PhnH [Thalassobacillus sp. C254]
MFDQIESRSSLITETQKVYRDLLYVFSNPGRVRALNTEYYDNDDSLKSIGTSMLLSQTLLDQEVSYYVHDHSELKKAISETTYAKHTPVKEAQYLFFYENYEIDLNSLERELNVGTLASPETSSTLIIRVDGYDKTRYRLTGPGINKEIFMAITGLNEKWMEVRERINKEFPLGIDFIFYTEEGEICALPRTTTITKMR